jgi:hypothetical protein
MNADASLGNARGLGQLVHGARGGRPAMRSGQGWPMTPARLVGVAVFALVLWAIATTLLHWVTLD